ncbi:MAG: hypothetical protein M3Z25_09190 [Actinomycetota bacterium]|nr:hypothetical protein [Actinomycetota bacterium]
MPTAAPAQATPVDRTTAWRITVAVVAATGPAAVGAVRLLLPYDTTDGTASVVTRPVLGAIAAVVSWLGFGSLAASVIIPDYAALAAVTSGAPNKTTVAMLDSLAGQAPTATAAIVFIPVMDADDLRRGLAALPALGSER